MIKEKNRGMCKLLCEIKTNFLVSNIMPLMLIANRHDYDSSDTEIESDTDKWCHRNFLFYLKKMFANTIFKIVGEGVVRNFEHISFDFLICLLNSVSIVC